METDGFFIISYYLFISSHVVCVLRDRSAHILSPRWSSFEIKDVKKKDFTLISDVKLYLPNLWHPKMFAIDVLT